MDTNQPGSGTRHKFTLALAAYACIAVMAWLTLDGKLRWAVWILMGGFAVKTWIASTSDSNR
jgi:hypothetical protein